MSSNPGSAILAGVPFVALDVGAARGLLPHWREVARFARLFMIEPDVAAHPGIQATLEVERARDARILGVALSETGGTQVLYLHAARSGSSLLPLRLPEALDYCDARHLFPVTEQTIDTRTLRDVMDECGEDYIDIIKLDTQGTELSILNGLDPERRSRLLAVELEIGMPGAYKGQATLSAIDAALTRESLELFDVIPKRAPLLKPNGGGTYHADLGTYRNAPTLAPRLFEIDACYFKKPAWALERGATVVRKLIVAYAVYGFFAHAYRLAERAHGNGSFSADEVSTVKSELRRWHRMVAIRRAPVDVAEKVLEKIGRRLRLRS